MLCAFLLVSLNKRYGEIIAKGVYNDYDGFVKSFRVPAPSIIDFWGVKYFIVACQWSCTAFRFMVQDKSGKEKSAGEKVNSEEVKEAILTQLMIDTIGGILFQAYKKIPNKLKSTI